MAEYIVDILADEEDGNFQQGDLSLREAIALANSNPGEDTIRIEVEGTITLTASSLSSLLAFSDAAKTTVIGPGADKLTISGDGRVPVLLTAPGDASNPGGTVQIEGVTIANGSVPFFVGIFPLSGGITNLGTLTLIDSVVTGNQSNSGGGILNRGVLTVINSTISNNTVATSGSAIDTMNAIPFGFIQLNGSVSTTLINTTISGNRASGDSSIGSAILLSSGQALIQNSTITNNTSQNLLNPNQAATAGIFATSNVSSVVVANSIIAGNTQRQTISPPIAADIGGEADRFQSSGSNLIGAVSANITSFVSTDRFTGNLAEVIGPLANNGGTTPTHALLEVSGNPAIDRGSDSDAPRDLADLDDDGNTSEAIPFDQRSANFLRFADQIDIGAFEFQLPIVSLTATDPTAAEAGDTGTFTLARTGSLTNPLAVPIALSGSASPADYTLIAGVGGSVAPASSGLVAIFLPNVSSFDLTLTAIADGITDPDETVTLTAQNGGSYELSSTVTGTVTIAELALPDTIAPTADLIDVVPDPRTTGIDSITLQFSEAVTGVDRADLQLVRNGTPIDLSSATLSGSGSTYTLGNLSALTATAGTYSLTLTASTSGIADLGGNALSTNATESWSTTGADSNLLLIPTAPNGATGTPLQAISFVPRGLVRSGTRRADRLRGGRKADRLNGGSGSDLLDGGNGNDLLNGGSGNDTLLGRNGRDLLNGNAGNDRLNGGNGSDILVGGAGSDTLTTGQGADMVVLSGVSAGVDTITDFQAQDLLDLRPIFRQAAFQTTGSPIDRLNQFVRLATVGGNTEVRIDTDGSGANATFTTLAVLQGVAVNRLSSLNFVV